MSTTRIPQVTKSRFQALLERKQILEKRHEQLRYESSQVFKELLEIDREIHNSALDLDGTDWQIFAAEAMAEALPDARNVTQQVK
jgi:hypothetical protein